MDGYHDNPTTIGELKKISNYKVCRSPLNDMEKAE